MPFGTSVVGFQELDDGILPSTEYVFLGLSLDGDPAPSRVGFMYVVAYSVVDGMNATVIDTRLVYNPGIYWKPETPPLDADTRLRIWVNWNFDDIAWFLYTP